MLDVELQLLADNVVDALLMQHLGDFVDAVGIVAADYGALFHVAEKGDFALFIFGQQAIHAADQHIGLNADFAQFFHRVLGGLGFDFTGSGDIGHIAQMHK